MPRKVSESVIVITGASSGIGRATAVELAGRGASLVLASRRENALDTVKTECEERGTRAITVPTDVTDRDAVDALALQAVETFGRIDVWFNNAAVTLFGRFEETPPEAYRQVIETNLFGYIHGTRAALPYLREQGSGVLINNDSIVASAPQPYTSAYVVSKAGIRALSDCLRMELKLDEPHDIHVCTLLPASIDTPFFQHAANYTGRAVKALDPVIEPERVARAVVRLIEHPKREVMVGTAGRAMAAEHAVAPGFYESTAARQIDRNHLQDAPADRTDGNLFEPAEFEEVHGGWKKRRTVMDKLAWAGAAVAVPALLLLGRRRRPGPRPWH